MAKKNMDILLGNILGDSTIIPQDKTDNPSEVVEENPKEEKCRKSVGKPNEQHWQHFSFICSKELVNKVQAIAHKEGFTIRTFMEYVMKQGVEAYEQKHGKVKKIRSKDIGEVMKK